MQSLLLTYSAYSDEIASLFSSLDWSQPDRALRTFEAEL
jgi:hypothetical protein